MSTPCACSNTRKDWPWLHSTRDPATANGLRCGADENDDTIPWAYPTADVMGFAVATAGSLNIAAGAWDDTPLGGTGTKRAGASLINTNGVFTAPFDGMYAYTFSFVPVTAAAFTVYARMVSSFSVGSWTNQFNQQQGASTTFLGGGMTLEGTLPAEETDTLTPGVFHNVGGGTSFTDWYVEYHWVSPIPS